MGLEREKQLAAGVLGSMAGLDAGALRVLASALRLGGGPLSAFSTALAYYADELEDRARGRPAGGLARLAMAVALHRAAFDPAALLARLEGADGPPWRSLRDAVLEVAG